jgi:hypothetical protein
MAIWATGIFLQHDKMFTKTVEIPYFMSGDEIQALLKNETSLLGAQSDDQTSTLMWVVMSRGYIPPLQWDAKKPAMICNAGGNDLLLYDAKSQQGMSEISWEKEYPTKDRNADYDQI